MKRLLSVGLRARLIHLLVTAFAALGGVLAWRLVLDQVRQIDNAKADLLVDARLIAPRQEVILERADALLNSLMLTPSLGPTMSAQVCVQQLADLLKREAAYLQT